MNIFPKKTENEEEIIVENPPFGLLIGISLLLISFLARDHVGEIMPGLIGLIGYIFIGIHAYRSFTFMKIVKNAMKTGINVHMSGQVFNPKKPVVYRVKKEDL